MSIEAIAGLIPIYLHLNKLKYHDLCQGRNFGGWRYRIIDRNYTPERSNVLHRRGMLLSNSIKKAPADKQGRQSGERLIEQP